MKQPFIRCSDKDTIEKLKANGFQLMEERNGVAVFLNDTGKKMSFDQSKIVFTNILTMATSQEYS